MTNNFHSISAIDSTNWLRLNYHTQRMRGHRQQWISHKMNNRHPWQLKKSKSWGPFLSYQLSSTANLANFEVNGLDWQCSLAGSSKMAPRILIFSIAMVANYSFYVKSIATYAPAFFWYNNSILARVRAIWQHAKNSFGAITQVFFQYSSYHSYF